METLRTSDHRVACFFVILCAAVPTGDIAAADDSGTEGHTVRYRVTGLFLPDRVADLKDAIKDVPNVALVSVDYESTEATFRFDPAQAIPGTRPEQVQERLDQLLRTASQSTFGVRKLCSVPRDKLQIVAIPIVGLDCKGCCLGAYEAIYQLDGVEQATASFKDGLVTAWIDPQKINRKKLEEALKSRGVELLTP